MTVPLTATIEDLGVQARDGLWMGWIHGRHPQTGAELAIGTLAAGGFVVVDPAARHSFAVRAAVNCETAWAIGQAPDGSIYQAGVHGGQGPYPLLRWDWHDEAAKMVVERPCKGAFTLGVAPDGRVYLPEYSANEMHRYDPASGRLESLGSLAAFGKHSRNVACANDGWVYVTSTDYQNNCIIGLAPDGKNFQRVTLLPPDASGWQAEATLQRDANGRVLVPLKRWGRRVWAELWGGAARAINQQDLALAQMNGGGPTPLAFADGSHVSQIDRDQMTYVDAAGKASTFTIAMPKTPLRIFSVFAAGGRVWGGTFIPLTLFAHDPATGTSHEYGNPTVTNGEIYSMLYAEDKLFLGSYYGAYLTRFNPALPWRRDDTIMANPANLGQMKGPPLPLMRPYGAAQSADGMLYFAACGGYGCEDSGISRINPKTEEVTHWLYPKTSLGAMIYLPGTDCLVLSEKRLGETAVRLTRVSPSTGKVLESQVLYADNGCVSSWLYDGGDLLFGLHDYRATLFVYSLSEQRIVRQIAELGFGDHCHNCLVFGPDERIWGLTARCVFSVNRELTEKSVVGEYADHAKLNAYRFGLARGPDGHLYFPNGPHLMRVRLPAATEAAPPAKRGRGRKRQA